MAKLIFLSVFKNIPRLIRSQARKVRAEPDEKVSTLLTDALGQRYPCQGESL